MLNSLPYQWCLSGAEYKFLFGGAVGLIRKEPDLWLALLFVVSV